MDSFLPFRGAMSPIEIEAPSAAQKHRADVEKAALRLAAGEAPRRAFASLPMASMTEAERADLMAAATVRARELVAANLRRNRILGITWCACGLIPLLLFTITWFLHGRWSLVMLIIGAPALINGYRILSLKRTASPDFE